MEDKKLTKRGSIGSMKNAMHRLGSWTSGSGLTRKGSFGRKSSLGSNGNQEVFLSEEARMEKEGDESLARAREMLKRGDVEGAKEAMAICQEKYAASGTQKKVQLIKPQSTGSNVPLEQDNSG